jgi:pyridoxal phosphate-dependent aminotransferase EpsN
MINKQIYLSPPEMSSKEKELLLNAFDSNWIAPNGPYVELFEKKIESYVNVSAACALSSGTAALHLALRVLDIKPGDKVLCPSFTFSASSNVILYEKAIPIFIDVDKKHWTLDLNLTEYAIKKYRPKAIIAVDVYGQSCNYKQLFQLCEKYNVYLIEDSAESLGSTFSGKKCGSFGHIGILSFNGNKIITTSGGGMLLSQEKKYVEKAKYLASQAREPVLHYEHKELGYNYRLSNLLSAIGCAQVERLENFVNKRRKIFDTYVSKLEHIDGISFTSDLDNSTSNRWLTTVVIDQNIFIDGPKSIINELSKNNIESRPVWKPMHMQPLYKDSLYVYDEKLDISKNLFFNAICLPSGTSLKLEDQLRIIDIFKHAINDSL